MTYIESTSEVLQGFIQNDSYTEMLEYIKNKDLTIEPFLIDILPEILNKLTNKNTMEQAKEVGEQIIKKMNPFAMKEYMNILYENFTSMKWQIKKVPLFCSVLSPNINQRLLSSIYQI